MKISFYLDSRKDKNQSVLRVLFSHNYKTKMKVTVIRCNLSEWDLKKSRPKRSMPNYYDVLDIVKALEEKMILAEIVAPTILQAIAIVFDREAFTFFDTCTDYVHLDEFITQC